MYSWNMHLYLWKLCPCQHPYEKYGHKLILQLHLYIFILLVCLMCKYGRTIVKGCMTKCVLDLCLSSIAKIMRCLETRPVFIFKMGRHGEGELISLTVPCAITFCKLDSFPSSYRKSHHHSLNSFTWEREQIRFWNVLIYMEHRTIDESQTLRSTEVWQFSSEVNPR